MFNIQKILFLPYVIFICTSCTQNPLLLQKVKTLDSLSGAVTAHLNEFQLQKSGSNAVSESVLIFKNYRQFINSKINDTLNKDEAIQLKNFFEAGESLLDLQKNMEQTVQLYKTLNLQIINLNDDIKHNTLEENEMNLYFKNEMQQAEKMLEQSKINQRLVDSLIQRFPKLQKQVEEIIKKRNGNQLPLLIQ